ncbi:uncharacterized protein G2W53_000354 [Senna tora]|uniref:Uncharacterized protein n=1 Tax=Senna tora TaxID=362788 RepID=A0A835CIE1_9FABA|nr:uncharacterized protein G2W53_000354 [Senna tora]
MADAPQIEGFVRDGDLEEEKWHKRGKEINRRLKNGSLAFSSINLLMMGYHQSEGGSASGLPVAHKAYGQRVR